MKQTSNGFTLIELMIVLAIIGIISTIALPSYMNHTTKAANKACLQEAKAYANDALARLNNREPALNSPLNGACVSYVGSGPSLTLNSSFTATPKKPGSGLVTCNLNSGGGCNLQ